MWFYTLVAEAYISELIKDEKTHRNIAPFYEIYPLLKCPINDTLYGNLFSFDLISEIDLIGRRGNFSRN